VHALPIRQIISFVCVVDLATAQQHPAKQAKAVDEMAAVISSAPVSLPPAGDFIGTSLCQWVFYLFLLT
jgi:hypothetical protein